MNIKNFTMKEIDILNNAIHNLEKNIPINWEWKTIDDNIDKGVDGKLSIIVNNQKKRLFVQIKKDVKNHQLFNILNYKNKCIDFLLGE